MASSVNTGLENSGEDEEAVFLPTEYLNSPSPSLPPYSFNRQISKEDHSVMASSYEILNTYLFEDINSTQSTVENKENLTYDDLLYEFYKAVVEGSQEAVEEVVFRCNIDINVVFTGKVKFITRKHCGWSAIHLAASIGNMKIMKFLLAEGCDIEAVTRDGETALHIAAKHGCADIVSLLLERNIYLRDRQNNQGVTALLKAIINTQYALKENYRRCVDLLLGAGCNPNISSSLKVTALHVAVDKGDFHFVQALLKSHANVNALCSNNTSPLMHALVSKYVNSNIVVKLLQAGADISLKMKERSTLHIAVSRCDDSVIEIYMKRGADSNCRDALGKTPLWIAVEENNIKVVPILVHGGGDVNYIREPQCISLLCQAIRNNSFNMVKLLLDLGASTYTETVMWSTPLHFAVEQQNVGIIKELLRANCSLNTASNAKYSLRPMTPMQLAMELGNVEIICLLMQAGCKIKASWLREDRISYALASKPDAVHHIQKFVSEVPSLLHLSCLSIREYLRDRFQITVQVLTQTGVIPNKIASYISLADILD